MISTRINSRNSYKPELADPHHQFLAQKLYQLQQLLLHKDHCALLQNGLPICQDMALTCLYCPTTNQEIYYFREITLLRISYYRIWIVLREYQLSRGKLSRNISRKIFTFEFSKEGGLNSAPPLSSRKIRSISTKPFGSKIWNALARVSFSNE